MITLKNRKSLNPDDLRRYLLRDGDALRVPRKTLKQWEANARRLGATQMQSKKTRNKNKAKSKGQGGAQKRHEITKAMLDAGADVLSEYINNPPSYGLWAEMVYSAMEAARPRRRAR